MWHLFLSLSLFVCGFRFDLLFLLYYFRTFTIASETYELNYICSLKCRDSALVEQVALADLVVVLANESQLEYVVTYNAVEAKLQKQL